MTKKAGRLQTVNEQFLARVKPEFEAWGLSQHPNPVTHFGRWPHGYCYDFADLRDPSNVRLALFAIVQPDANLMIHGYKAGALQGSERDLIRLDGNIKDLYILTRRWSLLRPLDIRFHLPGRSDKPSMEQAVTLIDQVMAEMYKLKAYLYG